MNPVPIRTPRLPEICLAILIAVVTAMGLWMSVSHSKQRRSVEALEAVAGSRPQLPVITAPLTDQEAARGFCSGALPRHLSRLEQDVPGKANAYGLTGFQLRFGPVGAWNGLAAADATLTFEGSQQDIGRALADAQAWIPSLSFEEVRLRPVGVRARLEARGRVVCLAS